jgi:hypothetical protein
VLETARNKTIDPVQRNRMRDGGQFEAAAIPLSPVTAMRWARRSISPFGDVHGHGAARLATLSGHFGYDYRPDPAIFSKVESFLGLCQS